MNADDIHKIIKKKILDCVESLALSEDDCLILLRYFKWNKE